MWMMTKAVTAADILMALGSLTGAIRRRRAKKRGRAATALVVLRALLKWRWMNQPS